MHDYRNVVRKSSDIFHNIKVQLRLCQINAVCGAERACQRINSAFLHKYLRLFRVGINLGFIRFSRIISCSGLSPSHGPKFSFYGCACPGCHGYCLFRILQIFLIWKRRAVIHDGRKAQIKRLLQIFQSLTMIQMHTHRNFGFLRHFYHNRSDQV